jgi:histidinol-phosphate aminotransferase
MRLFLKLKIPRHISTIVPYPPGKPQDELEREYGVKNSIKLASNENPRSPSEAILRALSEALPNLNRYPDGSCYYLTKSIAEKLDVSSSEIVIGNGSDDIIDCLVKAFVSEGEEVISSHPSFLMYTKCVQVRGGINRVVPMKDMHHDLDAIAAAVNERTRLIFLDNPNNPTGGIINPVDLYVFLSNVPEDVIVVLDEAYADFMDDEYRPDAVSLMRNTKGRAAVVFLRTFSKAYGIPGLRVGYGLMHKEVAACLHKVRQPFNVNMLAQIAAVAALDDEKSYQNMLNSTREGLAYLSDGLREFGCAPYPSQTNFILVDVKCDADSLYDAMLYEGVIIRSMASYGLPTCVRISVGLEEENVRCLNALEKCLKMMER